MALPRYERGATRHPLVMVPDGMRVDERTVPVPARAQDAVADLIRSWEFKRRVGFGTPDAPPFAGQEGTLSKRVLGLTFREPIRVVWADGCGFGYETRPGHPIYGEESFVLEGGVFTARSISRPSSPVWRMLAPALRLMQRSTHARYRRLVLSEVARAS
ncbi:DUF1990 family protein [Microbacterium sp. 3J1]|uniref:DUF1990 family protein n=1 Tax=Microbacterium sp. 3J1 TaxID=861269 RepID=UPI000AAC554C|nr:DUF1990 family protein [Microbacterium sp. 3J1]